MLQKPFDQIQLSDVTQLITLSVAESATLEYKQSLPGDTDEAKKEFLADISAFANARGGDIIFGVKTGLNDKGQNTGIPQSLVAIEIDSSDQIKQKLENVIRTGIAPRIKIQIREFTLENDGGFIFLIRVPKSLSAPHMVTYKNSSRFFTRNSAGKHQLDVEEIRSAFLANEAHAERIKRFREERLARIVADETPVLLMSTSRMVLHIVPIESFINRHRFDLSSAYNQLRISFPLIRNHGNEFRYNIDGFLNFQCEENSPSKGYTQIFSNGTVESVCADVLSSRNGKRGLASTYYEKQITQTTGHILKGYRELGMTGQVAVSLSLLGCRDSLLAVNVRLEEGGHPLDRDAVIMQEVVFETSIQDTRKALKPLFDQLWNAYGYPRSLNFTKDGIWEPH
ncbi:MAG: ATP-binding protein [Pirellulales bacterium]|nr:ATP-binding protein [Pirellulales bacterium]